MHVYWWRKNISFCSNFRTSKGKWMHLFKCRSRIVLSSTFIYGLLCSVLETNSCGFAQDVLWAWCLVPLWCSSPFPKFLIISFSCRSIHNCHFSNTLFTNRAYGLHQFIPNKHSACIFHTGVCWGLGWVASLCLRSLTPFGFCWRRCTGAVPSKCHSSALCAPHHAWEQGAGLNISPPAFNCLVLMITAPSAVSSSGF